MRLRVQKWGNSLALRIPKSVAQDSGIETGSSVELRLVDGSLLVTPIRTSFDLAELLAGVTDANLHEEVDPGGAVGREAW